MARLMVSVSGVRGVYGDGLDEGLAERFAFAFGTIYGGPVVVGRDSRKSGKSLARAVISGLRKSDMDVIDIGLASTPTTEMAVVAREAAGGIIITASHNPGEWNGLKFLGPDGVFISEEDGAEVLEEYEKTGTLEEFDLSGGVKTWKGANEHHIKSVLGLDLINPELIASAGFTVAFDGVNGAGGPICTSLLERLGCTIHSINTETTGKFAHDPEPVAANIADLCALVREKGADVGFAIDPDVDRLSLVDETGLALGEEYTLAIASDYLFEKLKSPAVCNLSTSRMIDDAAESHGMEVYRSAVGEINVVRMMREKNAVFGGEGNGGIILSALHPGRDAVLGIALILQIMAEKEKKLSELASVFPTYTIVKEKMELSLMNSWEESVRQAFAGEKLDETDGIKVLFPKAWVHVRASNTEPILRVISEAPTEEEAKELIDKIRCVLVPA